MAYIGKQPVIGNFVKLDAISVVNGQASYTMQNGGANFTEYSNVNQFLVSLNGILQSPTDSFTVSGSTITFASNLLTGDVIDFIIVLGNSLDVGVPSDNTVSLAKLTATGTKDATTFLRGDNTFASAGGDNTPSFFAKLSSDQSVPTTTFTKIEVDTEQFDTDGTYDNSTNYRFTPGVAGKYLISANVFLESMSDGKNFRADIFKNGASYIFGRCDSSKAGSSNSVNFTFLDTASASDYYELYIYHDEGSNLNVGGSSDRRTSFGAIKIIE